MASIAFDVLGYRWDQAEPAFTEVDEFYYHLYSDKLYMKVDFDAWLRNNSKLFAAGELGEPSLEWQTWDNTIITRHKKNGPIAPGDRPAASALIPATGPAITTGGAGGNPLVVALQQRPPIPATKGTITLTPYKLNVGDTEGKFVIAGYPSDHDQTLTIVYRISGGSEETYTVDIADGDDLSKILTKIQATPTPTGEVDITAVGDEVTFKLSPFFISGSTLTELQGVSTIPNVLPTAIVVTTSTPQTLFPQPANAVVTVTGGPVMLPHNVVISYTVGSGIRQSITVPVMNGDSAIAVATKIAATPATPEVTLTVNGNVVTITPTDTSKMMSYAQAEQKAGANIVIPPAVGPVVTPPAASTSGVPGLVSGDVSTISGTSRFATITMQPGPATREGTMTISYQIAGFPEDQASIIIHAGDTGEVIARKAAAFVYKDMTCSALNGIATFVSATGSAIVDLQAISVPTADPRPRDGETNGWLTTWGPELIKPVAGEIGHWVDITSGTISKDSSIPIVFTRDLVLGVVWSDRTMSDISIPAGTYNSINDLQAATTTGGGVLGVAIDPDNSVLKIRLDTSAVTTRPYINYVSLRTV